MAWDNPKSETCIYILTFRSLYLCNFGVRSFISKPQEALWHHISSYIASKMGTVVPHRLPSTLIFPEQNRNHFIICCLHLNRISLCCIWPQNQWPHSKIKNLTLQHIDLVRFANHDLHSCSDWAQNPEVPLCSQNIWFGELVTAWCKDAVNSFLSHMIVPNAAQR